MDLADFAAMIGASVPDWHRRGACRERPDVDFFPEDGIGVALAQRVCAECSVADECLAYALEHREEHGVWGGRSQRWRARYLKAAARRRLSA